MPNVLAGDVQHDQMLGAWFSVEVGGIVGMFTDAGGLGIEIEVVKDETSNKDSVSRLMPGRVKYQDITLKRRLSTDKAFWEWIKSIRDGKADFRKDGSIVMYNMSGEEQSRWNFFNAWPSSWSASDPDVGADDPITEEITLSVEILTRVS